MEIQNANQNQVQENPPVNESVMPPVPTVPSIPTPTVDEVPEVKPEIPVLNCTNCGGEGLLGDPAGQHDICPTCNGTGKG